MTLGQVRDGYCGTCGGKLPEHLALDGEPCPATNTVERLGQLFELPIGTVLHLDALGKNFIAQKTVEGWSLPGDWTALQPENIPLPASILYRGVE